MQHDAGKMRDQLTCLPNRAAFFDMGRKILRLSNRSNRVALHVMHISNLKSVIMERSLPVGEAALKILAQRLYGVFGEDKVFARLGGDVFGLLQQGVGHDGHALYTARRVFECLEDPVMIDGVPVPVEIWTGISFCPDHGTTLEVLYDRAANAPASTGGESGHRCVLYRGD